jgi:subtilisin family serine protease
MIVPARVVESFGDVDVWTVADALENLRKRKVLNKHTIVNMSFGGYADDHMSVLAAAVRRVRRTGAVVVASAGNDATDRPMFPACLPDVVAVGALDPYGPAAFTNFGAWVDACAPGTDLVSAFFEFDGKMEVWPMPGSADPDKFEQWARWSGTSFAAPIVAAALVRQMVLAGGTARDAVEQVITAGGLFRLPGLGTVVNHTPLDPGCLAKW